MKRPCKDSHDRIALDGQYMPQSKDALPVQCLCALIWLAFSAQVIAIGWLAEGLGPTLLLGLLLALLPCFLVVLCWVLKGRPPITFTYARVLGFLVQLVAGLVGATAFFLVTLAASIEDSVIREQVSAWAEQVYGNPDGPAVDVIIAASALLLMAALLGATRWIWWPVWKAADSPARTVTWLARHFSHELVDDHADSIPLPPRLSGKASWAMKRRYLYRGRGSGMSPEKPTA